MFVGIRAACADSAAVESLIGVPEFSSESVFACFSKLAGLHVSNAQHLSATFGGGNVVNAICFAKFLSLWQD